MAFADGEITAGHLRTARERMRDRRRRHRAEAGRTTRAPVLADLVTVSDLGAAWDALSLAKRRAVVDVLITVTILPTGRGGRAFRPESVRIEWKDDTVT
ncbi:MAG TPA: hypothetical protein VF317_03615 [Dermatophilaceae bacterium]